MHILNLVCDKYHKNNIKYHNFILKYRKIKIKYRKEYLLYYIYYYYFLLPITKIIENIIYIIEKMRYCDISNDKKSIFIENN